MLVMLFGASRYEASTKDPQNMMFRLSVDISAVLGVSAVSQQAERGVSPLQTSTS